MELVQKFRELNKTCFIVGASGESGKALLKELMQLKPFSRVVLIGRRRLEYQDEELKNLEQRVVDFDKLEQHQNDFSNFDVGYCCLGTTRGKAGKEGFVKIEHDYVVGSANLALQGGCKHFHLVSSQGVDENSSFLYQRTKGQTDRKVSEMGFDRVSIYRPAIYRHLRLPSTECSNARLEGVPGYQKLCFGGERFYWIDGQTARHATEDGLMYHPFRMLMVDREESRPLEWMVRTVLKPVACVAPAWITTPIQYLARAMVMSTVSTDRSGAEILDNKQIHALSKSPDPFSSVPNANST